LRQTTITNLVGWGFAFLMVIITVTISPALKIKMTGKENTLTVGGGAK